MDYYYKYLQAIEDINILEKITLILIGLLALVIIRNWYNLYKKRSYRKHNKKITAQLEANKTAIANYNKQTQKLEATEQQLADKHTELFKLNTTLEDYKQKFYSTLSEKEKEIAKQKEQLDNQKNAYERYVNFKNVELNNTRLGAHFIKNVISQIYEDLEQTDNNYKSFLGINYKFGKSKSKVPPIKALKNIFKLLDYNVSALHRENTTIEEELSHISMFLELIQYLKPNAKINIDDQLKKAQKHQLKIKPTLFFPFVENALKHGSLNDEQSFISIVLKENENNQLSYCLVNSAEQKENYINQASQTSNFGLNALQQLLNAYYPNSKLEHKNLPNNQYLSELIISLN